MGPSGTGLQTLAAILAALPDPVLAIDGEGRLVFANKAAEGCFCTFTNEFQQLCDRVRRSGAPQALVTHAADGGTLEWRALAAGEDLVVVSRAAGRHDLAAELAAARRDNQTLLQEVHHRVKNSLQVVSAMLRMQSWRLADSPMRRPFEEACGRIQALATVHETLYRQGSPGAVDFAAILIRLIDGLAGARADDRNLEPATIDGGGLLLTIDKAIPAALIIQEWLSAATGPVTVGLVPGGPIIVTGLAAMDPASLGARMVAVLAAQLHGRIESFSGPPPGMILHLKRDDLGAMTGGGQKPAEVGAGDSGGHVIT